MNYKRIYQYRFQGINSEKKQLVWKCVADYLYDEHLGKPRKILDPAGGRCEFINAVPSEEKWTIDMDDDINKYVDKDVKLLIGNNLEVDLPKNYFDAVFVSNFLEHLNSQEEVAVFLEKMYASLRPGGRIAVLGPNFKYVFKDYFDFADHTVILSELGVAEHMYGAGFEINKIVPKFLPLSFRSGGYLPVNKLTIKTYLSMPLAWKIMGKQFLLIGEKPAA